MTAFDNPYLPVPDPTLSYWQTQPHELHDHRSTPELPDSCDILIIGAGMAGVATAYHLSAAALARGAAAPPSIVLLDARALCSGATGRNGGHVKVKTDTLLRLRRTHGPAFAQRFAVFVRAQIAALKDTVEREGLDCEFELRRSWDVLLDETEAAEMKSEWEKCLESGEDWTKEVTFVGKDWAEQLTSVKGAQAAFNSPVCSLWPYKFVSQLLARALALNPGLNLQTHTPALTLSYSPSGEITAHTPRGVISAKKLVLATNAYTAGLLEQFRGIITPYKGTAAHLAPPTPVHPHLAATYNLNFGGGDVHTDYFNPRPDGGIVLGGAKWLYVAQRQLWYDTVDDASLLEPVMHVESKDAAINQGYFDGYMQRNFHGWEGSECKTRRVWTGIMGETPDGLPHIGLVPGSTNQYILAGFNGGGMSQIFLCTKGVANMILHGVCLEDSGAGIPVELKATKERLQARGPRKD